MSHLPGFEVFREGSKDERILHDAVLTKLTRTLGEWRLAETVAGPCTNIHTRPCHRTSLS